MTKWFIWELSSSSLYNPRYVTKTNTQKIFDFVDADAGRNVVEHRGRERLLDLVVPPESQQPYFDLRSLPSE